MLFSKAFDMALLEGKAMTRTAWIEPFNPDDRPLYPFIIVLPRQTVQVAPGEETANAIPAALDLNIKKAIAVFMPPPEEGANNLHFAKFTPSTSQWQIGWSPSSEDLFATDWVEY